MELGKNATDELYSSSKWPFLQANMKINLILDYWDARNSLLYNLITSFIDGVTFVVISATQSIHRCYLQNVADISYAAITKCHFWSDFSKFWIENVHTSVVEVIGGHRGSKRRSTQCPRADLNKRFLPRANTATAWKLIPHRSNISKN